MHILPSVKQGWERDVKTFAQGGGEMVQLVKVLAAKPEFHPWYPRVGRREPITGSCTLIYTIYSCFCCVFVVVVCSKTPV